MAETTDERSRLQSTDPMDYQARRRNESCAARECGHDVAHPVPDRYLFTATITMLEERAAANLALAVRALEFAEGSGHSENCFSEPMLKCICDLDELRAEIEQAQKEQ